MKGGSDVPHPDCDASAAFGGPEQPTIGRPRGIVADGIQWDVLEIEIAERPWAHSGRCLLFVSPEVIRRVWGYPADWWQLPADELYAVSWRR